MDTIFSMLLAGGGFGKWKLFGEVREVLRFARSVGFGFVVAGLGCEGRRCRDALRCGHSPSGGLRNGFRGGRVKLWRGMFPRVGG